MKQFKTGALESIESASRISSIDIFRAIAIIAVVLFHFNVLQYGYLGVDLFFVISGLLVGGILTKNFKDGERINFFRFILQRGFKIWPSYYIYIIAGSILAYLLYSKIAPGQLVPLSYYPRYLFFYRNFRGLPFYVNFDHLWSLCVEEHFYVLLPILFIVIQRYFNRKTVLFFSVVSVIVVGILFKYLVLVYTHSKDTEEATYNRLDALAWGVLLNLIVTWYPQFLNNIKRQYLLFTTGISLLAIAIIVNGIDSSIIYQKVIFISVAPFCFFLMIAGVYYVDFSRLKYLRIVAYYSYNWYLWHQIFVVAIAYYLGDGILGFSVYFIGTFLVAVLFTVVVEEPFLRFRKRFIDRVFNKPKLKSYK